MRIAVVIGTRPEAIKLIPLYLELKHRGAEADLILTGQTAEGGALPLIKPLTHTPGKEPTPALEDYRSDDALWLPLSVAALVDETGDASYLDTVLPYADAGEDTVLGHLVQALRFSLEHRGAHAGSRVRSAQPGAQGDTRGPTAATDSRNRRS